MFCSACENIFENYIRTKPQSSPAPEYDMKPDSRWPGVTAFTMRGAPYKGKDTTVFGHVGFPGNPTGEKLPAVVLVHGGGGHPYPEWIRIWNARGYAAIAVDNTGYFPNEIGKGYAGTESDRNDKYTRMNGENGWYSAPDNDRVETVHLPVEEQWLYHAIADTILGANVLFEDKRINPNRVGIVGVSWGGVLVSQIVGFDTRYAFAIASYGSAYLDKGLSRLDKAFHRPEAAFWRAQSRYADSNVPVLWMCWNEDICFSIQSNSLSYLDTRKSGSLLSIRSEMNHSHTHTWIREECYRFADSYAKGCAPMVACLSEPEGFGTVSFRIAVPREGSLKATVYYLTEPMKYNSDSQMLNDWHTTQAQIQGDTVTAKIPEDADSYYIEICQQIGDSELVTSTSYITRNPMGNTPTHKAPFYPQQPATPLEDIPWVEDGGLVSLFRTVGCIGDSLSSGDFESTDHNKAMGYHLAYHDTYPYAWGEYLSKMAGFTLRNFSRGAMTAREYCETYGEAQGYWRPDLACQAYIIALGVNDLFEPTMGYPLGSLADVHEDWHKNALTYAGYMGQLISRYKQIAPDAKFFLMTIPRDLDTVNHEGLYELSSAQAALMYDLAARFENTYVLDFRAWAPAYYEEFYQSFFVGGHLNVLGYVLTAKLVAAGIDHIIRTHPEDFARVGFIGTPYRYRPELTERISARRKTEEAAPKAAD